MTKEIDLSKLPPPEPYDEARNQAQRKRLMDVWRFAHWSCTRRMMTIICIRTITPRRRR